MGAPTRVVPICLGAWVGLVHLFVALLLVAATLLLLLVAAVLRGV